MTPNQPTLSWALPEELCIAWKPPKVLGASDKAALQDISYAVERAESANGPFTPVSAPVVGACTRGSELLYRNRLFQRARRCRWWLAG